MKHLKMLSLAVAAVVVLMVFTGGGSASATVLEDGSGNELTKGSTLDLSLTGTATVETLGGSSLYTCTGSTIEGTTSNTGSATETIKTTIGSAGFTWSGCSTTVSTTQGGELEIHHIAGTSNGTLTGNTFEVTVVAFGVSCTYGLSNNDTMRHLGTLNGSDTTPTITINTTISERTEDKFLCPNEVRWTATYHVTTPKGLTITTSPVPTTLEDAEGNHPSAIDASLVGTATLETTGSSVLDTCTGGTLEGGPSTGGATESVQASIAKEGLTWSGCTKTTHTIQGGELEIRHIAGTSDGKVRGTTFEVTVEPYSGTSCTYGLNSSDSMTTVGTLKGSDTTPTIEINIVVVERTEDKFLCPNDVRWTATYHVTEPSGLTVTAG